MSGVDVQNKLYTPVGHCIYCDEDGITSTLRNEHIVPRALGGTLILPKASCKRCEGVTSYIEGAVTRDMLGAFRATRGLPTRRPKERPTHFRMVFDYGRHQITRAVPTALFPSCIAMPMLNPPRMISGAKPTNIVGNYIMVRIPSNLNPAIDVTGTRHVGFKVNIKTPSFMRMIAKIAHSFAVAEYGLGSFEPLLPDFILGKELDGSYYVGGFGRQDPPRTRHDHLLRLEDLHHGGRRYLAATIRLFGNLGMPVYRAIVGVDPNT